MRNARRQPSEADQPLLLGKPAGRLLAVAFGADERVVGLKEPGELVCAGGHILVRDQVRPLVPVHVIREHLERPEHAPNHEIAGKREHKRRGGVSGEQKQHRCPPCREQPADVELCVQLPYGPALVRQRGADLHGRG